MPGLKCAYVGKEGHQCKGFVTIPAGLCFWHDPDAPRDSPELKRRLEEWMAAGNTLEGVSLRYANLEGLVIHQLHQTQVVNIQGADFYRANLRKAHLFAADLRGASLMKCDLSGATLNQALMEDTNFLGTKFGDGQLSQVIWGKQILQEKQGAQVLGMTGWIDSQPYFSEAREVYRGLYIACQEKGLKEEASVFYIKMRKMQQKLLKPLSWDWVLSHTVNLTCGYGERPSRVIGFSLGIIILWSVIYNYYGVLAPEGVVQFQQNASFSENLSNWVTCFYYSVVTFTTLGYGDIVPQGWVRLVAGGQAFIGAFTTALFVVVFAKKTLR